MSKHTPGPWGVVEHSWARTGIYASHVYVAALDIEAEATDETQAEWEAVMAANARLIAAAPDLLGALVMARALLVDVEGYEVDGASVSVVDAAIAKATGENT